MDRPVSRISTDVDYGKDGKQVSFLAVPSSTNESAYGVVPIPITVIKGGKGPTIFFSAGVHGDEYEGQVTLMKLARRLQPGDIRGRVIIIPALNLPAALAGQRCSPIDGLNLNRIFPGERNGSITHMIAHYVSAVVLPLSDVQVDLHSGGKTLEYIPTMIMNASEDKERERRAFDALIAFGLPIGLFDWKADHGGLFEMTCEEMGVLSINTELGGAGIVSKRIVAMAERGVSNLLKHFGLMSGKVEPPEVPTRLMQVKDPRATVMAPDGGLYEPFVDLGDEIKDGHAIGQVHYQGHTEKEPWVVRARLSGLLILKRPPGRVERGDVIAQVAQDFAYPR